VFGFGWGQVQCDETCAGVPLLLPASPWCVLAVSALPSLLPPNPTHLDGLCRLDGHAIVSRVAIGQAQVVVLDVQVEVGQDELRRVF
jgi:hypothetical protein